MWPDQSLCEVSGPSRVRWKESSALTSDFWCWVTTESVLVSCSEEGVRDSQVAVHNQIPIRERVALELSLFKQQADIAQALENVPEKWLW